MNPVREYTSVFLFLRRARSRQDVVQGQSLVKVPELVVGADPSMLFLRSG